MAERNHVTLPAEDDAASRAFDRALGLQQIVAAPPRYACFGMDNGTTLSFEVMGDGGRGGAAEIDLWCADVDADCRAASDQGVTSGWAPRHEADPWRCARTTDPAGNRIFLYNAGNNQRFPPWRIDGRTTD
jgi:hydroxymethylpyrimidine/phosphomethylpyrimidine kinase